MWRGDYTAHFVNAMNTPGPVLVADEAHLAESDPPNSQGSDPSSSVINHERKRRHRRQTGPYNVRRSEVSIPASADDFSVQHLEPIEDGARRELQVTFYPASSRNIAPQLRPSCGQWPPMTLKELISKIDFDRSTIRSMRTEPDEVPSIKALPARFTCFPDFAYPMASWDTMTDAAEHLPMESVKIAKRDGAVSLVWPEGFGSEGKILTYVAYHPRHKVPTANEIRDAPEATVLSNGPMSDWLGDLYRAAMTRRAYHEPIRVRTTRRWEPGSSGQTVNEQPDDPGSTHSQYGDNDAEDGDTTEYEHVSDRAVSTAQQPYTIPADATQFSVLFSQEGKGGYTVNFFNGSSQDGSGSPLGAWTDQASLWDIADLLHTKVEAVRDNFYRRSGVLEIPTVAQLQLSSPTRAE